MWGSEKLYLLCTLFPWTIMEENKLSLRKNGMQRTGDGHGRNPWGKGRETFQFQVSIRGCTSLSWEEKLLIPTLDGYQELPDVTEGRAEFVIRTQQRGVLGWLSRLSVYLWLWSWSQGPGMEPHIHQAPCSAPCFSLCAPHPLPLSPFLLSQINKIFKKNTTNKAGEKPSTLSRQK